MCRDEQNAAESWDDIRIAWEVARNGTLSGAAQALGIHHATVMRRIDGLEARLGVKLFQRHARGYTPTEAGADLLQTAGAAAEQFGALAGRLRGRGAAVSGELVVTSLAEFAPLLIPALAGFQADNPDLSVRLVTDERVFRLDYGEAHVAVRAGAAPQEPDNVVQPLARLAAAPFASAAWVARHGRPETLEALTRCRFVAMAGAGARAPTARWVAAHVDPARVIFRTSDAITKAAAVEAGAGVGFLPLWRAGKCAGLIQLWDALPEWESPCGSSPMSICTAPPRFRGRSPRSRRRPGAGPVDPAVAPRPGASGDAAVLGAGGGQLRAGHPDRQRYRPGGADGDPFRPGGRHSGPRSWF
jgi:DNA-binding transcriptional LysR family regulator